MKITYELDLERFEAWSGGADTLERIVNEGKCAELEAVLEDLYPIGLEEDQLNDILWFDDDWCFEVCGIRTEAEIREELDELLDAMNELMENFLDDTEDIFGEEKDNFWEENYASEYAELEKEVEELEEELENI